MNSANQQISAVILAGGQGLRFGGQDKGLVKLNNKSLIEHVIEKITSHVDEIIISCNRNLQTYKALGYKTIQDSHEGFQGPLAGILKATSLCKHELVLIVPCDTPLIPTDLVELLLNKLLNSDKQAVYVHDGLRPQFLFCLFRGETLPKMEQLFMNGNKSVYGWLNAIDSIGVKSDRFQAESFININTPAELEQAKKLLL